MSEGYKEEIPWGDTGCCEKHSRKEEIKQEAGQAAERQPAGEEVMLTGQTAQAAKFASAQTEVTEPAAEAPGPGKTEPAKAEAIKAGANGFSAKEQLENELSGLSVQREQMNRELADANRAMTRDRENVIRDRRDQVAEIYEKQLRAVDKEIKAVTEKRQKARNQGVQARVEERTQALSGENAELQSKLTNLFKDNHVPAICRTGFFYTFTMPRGLQEILSAALGFVTVFGILPMLTLFFMFGGGEGKKFWTFMLVYFADIVIFGGLYVMLNTLKTKHLPVIREGRGLRDRMRANRKQIAQITREIRRDRNDSLYDLQAFDDQLTQRSQEREDLLQKKSQALEEFDAVTRNVLSDEVTGKHAPHIAELEARLGEMDAKIAAVEAEIRNL